MIKKDDFILSCKSNLKSIFLFLCYFFPHNYSLSKKRNGILSHTDGCSLQILWLPLVCCPSYWCLPEVGNCVCNQTVISSLTQICIQLQKNSSALYPPFFCLHFKSQTKKIWNSLHSSFEIWMGRLFTLSPTWPLFSSSNVCQIPTSPLSLQGFDSSSFLSMSCGEGGERDYLLTFADIHRHHCICLCV